MFQISEENLYYIEYCCFLLYNVVVGNWRNAESKELNCQYILH